MENAGVDGSVGGVQLFQSLEAFDLHIKQVEDSTNVKFVKHRIRRYASVDDLTSLNGKRIRFSDDGHPQTVVSIPFDGIPYVIMDSETLECQHGPSHNRGNTVKKTKKIGCPAQIRVRRILKFPDYKIVGPPTERRTRAIAQKLKAEFGVSINKEVFIYALIADINDHHNHPVGEVAGFTLPIDKKIIAKIKELAENGHRNVASVKVLLQNYVKKELAPTASRGSHRYYPTNKEIRDHIYLAVIGANLSSASEDQKSVCKKVENYKTLHPKDNFFFRPSSSSEEGVCSMSLVIQTQFQQNLLVRYGQETTLMDATYKTTKYDIPLYNIYVHTNCGFQVVGSFFISKDTVSSVSEALRLCREWNPEWNPKYFICDFDLKEISAIEGTFSDSHVFLCEFHRDKAWQRWLTKNQISNKDEVLKQLRSLACSNSVEEYQASLDKIHNSETKFKTLFSGIGWKRFKWIQNCKRWVFYHRKHLLSIISTTNGIENQHKELKHRYLKEFGIGKSLSNVTEVIVEQFFPDAEISYKRGNAIARDDTRSMSEVPNFLKNRPKTFLSHCLERLPPKVGSILPSNITEMRDNCFQVRSVDSKETYEILIVDNMPKC